MRRHKPYKILNTRILAVFLTILTMAIVPSAKAQNTVTRMTNRQTLEIDACAMQQGTIVDDGGETGDYSNSFDGYVVINASQGTSITLTGGYETEACCDRLKVWDGDEASGTLLDQFQGSGSMNATATSGTMTIYFHTDGSLRGSGFVLTYTVDVTGIADRVSALAATGVTTSGATLTWSSTGAGPFHVAQDGVEIGSTSSATYSLGGLQASQRYDITVYPEVALANRCAHGRLRLRTLCGTTGIPLREDFDDLPTGVMPGCWTRSVNFDDTAMLPRVMDMGNGNKSLMLSCGGNTTAGHYGMVISPTIETGETVWDVEFSHRASHSGVYVTLGVCDSISPEHEYYGFTPLTSFYSYNNSEMDKFHWHGTVPSGAAKLALRMDQSMQGGATRMVYIDSLSVTTCGIETARTYHTDTTSTIVEWSTYGSPQVDVCVRRKGVSVDETTYTAAVSPMVVAGLTPGTDYIITLRPRCDGRQQAPRELRLRTESLEGLAETYCGTPTYHNGQEYVLNDGWNSFNTSLSSTAYIYSNGFLIMPPMANLGGKEVLLKYYNNECYYMYDDSLAVGTMAYADDTSTFTPITKIPAKGCDYHQVSVSIPDGCTDRYVAVRSDAYCIGVRAVSVDRCEVSNPRFEHVYGTSVVVKWDTPVDDTVIVEYYRYSYERMYDTITAGTTDTIRGLNPGSSYYFLFYRPCGGRCEEMVLSTTTARKDYGMPLCEDFDNNFNYYWQQEHDWWRYRTEYNDPSMSETYSHTDNYSIKLTATSEWSRADFTLPDIPGIGGKVISFWGLSMAPASKIMMMSYDEKGHSYDMQYDFHIFDSIIINGNGIWNHYSLVLPDTMSLRLSMTYRLTGIDGLFYLWLDDVQLGKAGYGNFTFANINAHSVDVVAQRVQATAIGIKLVGGDSTFYGYSESDTVHFDGLDSNTVYRCYVAPIDGTDTMCFSYAGQFLTPRYSTIGGGGDNSILACNTMDDLLSTELPNGWTFSDSTVWSVVYGEGLEGSDALRADLDATIPATSVVLPELHYEAFYLAAKGVGEHDTLFVTGDTVVLDSAVWRYYLCEPPESGHITLRIVGDGCRLDNVGFSNCQIIDFVPEGNALRCNTRNGVMHEYTLTLTDPDGGEQSFHITSDGFLIENLRPSTTYTARWSCLYEGSWCMPAITVRTNPIALPYCIDFRTGNYNALPDGWEVVSSEDIWHGMDSPTQYYFSASWNNGTYIILPETESYNNLSMEAIGSYNNVGDIEFGILTDPSDTSTFIGAPTHMHNESGRIIADLSALPHGGRVAIHLHNNYLYISTIALNQIPAVNYRLYSADSLTAEPESTGEYWLNYQTSYYSSGNGELARYMHADSGAVNIPYSSSSYMYVQAMADSLPQSCIYPMNFPRHTKDTVPHCYDFNYSNNSFFTIEQSHYTHSAYYNTIDNNRVIYFYPSDWLIFPYISNADVNQLNCTYRYRHSMWDNNNGLCNTVVGVMTDALDPETFVPVDTLLTRADNEWHDASFSLSSYNGTGRWVAIKSDAYGISNNYIDDVRIESCSAAIHGEVSLARYNIVQIDNPIDSDDFYVEYGAEGFAQGSGTTLHVETVPFQVTLEPETTYDFYFYCSTARPSCATAHKVTTLGEPLPVPSCIDFDTCVAGSMPRSWTVVKGPSHVSDSVSYSGTSAMTVAGIIATPDILVDSLQKAVMSLWVMATSSDSRLIVGTMTNPDDEGSFHMAKTLAPKQVGVWEHHFISFADSPSNAHFVALRNSSGNKPTILVDDIHISDCGAFDFRIAHVDNNFINFQWQETGAPSMTLTMIDNGADTTMSISGGQLTLPVAPGHDYTFYVHSECSAKASCAVPYDDTVHIVGPAEGVGCVNPTDLQSPQAIFYSGTYNNPYSDAGAIDHGSLSADSRHTVCYDTSYRDPRTGGMLRTIPEGYISSVRLGNWSTNLEAPEAEGVIYSLMPDSLNFDMLMMRYAAVLQDPLHDPVDQPRFRLEILDSLFNPIDPLCASADFIANRNLGWNEAADNVLWKDWTAVGIDLSDYAGQQVYARLTTYDCNEGSHYGYAYFTLECMKKVIQAETCGDVDSNRFTAPAGFAYRWHTTESNTTIGTEQRLTVPTATQKTYQCELSFVGNNACRFTLTAFGGTRHPLARLDTAVHGHDCQLDVDFTNLSAISADGVNPIGTGEQCNTAYWDFGNGETSSNYHASTTYHHYGTYNVTLIVGISGGCHDTLEYALNLRPPTISGPEYICAGSTATLTIVDGTTADPLWPGNTHPVPTTMADTAAPIVTTVLARGHNGCDTMIQHSLRVVAQIFTHDTLMLCEKSFPLMWNDTLLTLDGTTMPLTDTVHFDQQATMPSYLGCDSTTYTHFIVVPQPQLTVPNDTTVISGATLRLNATSTSSIRWTSADGSVIADTCCIVVSPDSTTTYYVHSYSVDGHTECSIHDSVTITTLCGHEYDSLVCTNDMPFAWNGTTVSDTGTYQLTMSSKCGDSLVVMHLNIKNVSTTYLKDTITYNDIATFTPPVAVTVSYNEQPTDPALVKVIDTAFVFPNIVGCDSTVIYRLYLYRNYHTTDSVGRCDNELPYLWQGGSYSADTSVTLTLTGDHGVDSVVTLVFTVNPTYDVNDTIIICPYRPYLYEEIDYGGPASFDSPHLSTHGCDSLVHVCLMPRDSAFRLTPQLRLDHSEWYPYDTVLLGCRPALAEFSDTSASVSRTWWLWNTVATPDTVSSTDTLFADTLSLVDIYSFRLIAVDSNGCYDTVQRDSLIYIFQRPTSEYLWRPNIVPFHDPKLALKPQATPADSLTYRWLIALTAGGGDYDTLYHDEQQQDSLWHYSWEPLTDTGSYDVALVSYWKHTLTLYDTLTLSIHCTDTAHHDVQIVNTYLQFPSLVTPNGDGDNDIWEVVNLVEMGQYPVNEVWIYNQWGALVYHAKNIDSHEQAWDPNATNSPDGTYFFRFSGKGRWGVAKFNGTIEVLR